MEPQEQIGWETRVGRLAAAAAFLSGLLTLVSVILQATLGSADDEREALLRVDDEGSTLAASLAAQTVAYLLLAFVLYFLIRAIQARRPQVPRIVIPLLALFPVLLIVGGVLTQLDLGDLADKFVTSGPQTEKRAEDLLDDRSVIGPVLGSAGTLCLALSLVLVSVNGIRAGLLSRFMGVLGVIIGALLILPLFPGGQGTVQIFWTVALGFLFLGRWPGGRGPAWETGEAIPWPSAADRKDLAEFEGDPSSAEALEPAQEGEPTQASPRKRKRKKKRGR